MTRSQQKHLVKMAEKMAENLADNLSEQEHQLNDPGHQDECSDSESESSVEQENTPLTRLETEMKDEMSLIATQVKETVLGMSQKMEQKFTILDRQIHNLEIQLMDRNNNQNIDQPRNITPSQINMGTNIQVPHIPVSSSVTVSENIISQTAQSPTYCEDTTNTGTSTSTTHARADNYVKLKPQTFTGTNDDFEDFLTQFEITTEINGWNYKSKSLYLANSLTGAARALLNELNAEQRRDYNCLVNKLTERYGPENRAEVFRSQLKSRVKVKGETTAELAQAIRKLTRQAYPRVSLDVIEALAVDHFVDALSEAQIRLRLREVGPATIAEAEKIAVRMEANITADKQRTRFVGKVEQSNHDPQDQSTEQQMENISKRIDTLSKSVQDLTRQHRFQTPTNPRPFPPSFPYNNPRSDRPDNRNLPSQRNFQSRGGNSNVNHSNRVPPQFQRNQSGHPGNFQQPTHGSRARLN
ncbi:MAG: hypothetical protein ABW185_00370 [Sedimenticola sp.]